MKKREERAMLKIEAMLHRLKPKAQKRVVMLLARYWLPAEVVVAKDHKVIIDSPHPEQRKDFVERFWSAKVMNGIVALTHYDIPAGDDVIAGVLGITSARKLAAELLIAADALDPEGAGGSEHPRGVMHPELGVDEGGVFGAPDGIFDVDPNDTQLSDAELTAHVYGLIRMGLKEGVMNHLNDPDRCEAIIRGTGRQDLFAAKDDGERVIDLTAEEVYEVLERLENESVAPESEGAAMCILRKEVSAVLLMSVRESDGLAYGHVMDLKVSFLTERFLAQLTDIIRQYTHECMLPMINQDDDLRALYESGGKARVVDLWERLRTALGLAYETANR